MTIPEPPRFDIDALRVSAGDRVFARGKNYQESGQVELLLVEPRRVLARVMGSEVYRVTLTGTGRGIGGDCSCPAFEDSGFCKHMVAAALAANALGEAEAAEGGGVLDRVRAYLEARSVDDLTRIVMDLAEDDPVLLRRLEMAAAAVAGDDETVLKSFRAAIDTAIGPQHYIDYGEARAWAAGVATVLENVAALGKDGRADLALRLIDQALPRIEEAIGGMDDSEGEGGGLLARAQEIHLAACGIVRPDPVELAQDLFEREMESDYDAFDQAAALYADILGKDGLAEYRRLAVAAWEKLPARAGRRPAADGCSDERYRLTGILDFFAEREGDVEARIAIRAKDLSSPYNYLELGQFCLSHGREAEALRWAEEGLWMFEDGRPDERLVEFAADLLQRAGRGQDAETRLWQAFEREPSLQLYKRLRTLSGEAVRDRALSFVEARLSKEKASSWYFPGDLLTRMLMAENMHGEAWKAALKFGASTGLKEELARETGAAFPREALSVYAERVEQLARAGGNGNYEEARRLIARMAPLRKASEQAAYLAELRVRHKAKRNLMKLLDRL